MVRENCIVQPWIFVNQEVICDNARLRIQQRICERLWMMLFGHNQRKLPKNGLRSWDGSTEKYLKLSRTLLYLQELSQFSEKFFILPRSMREVFIHRQLSEGSRNCLRLPKNIWDYRQLCENYKNYLRFPRTPNENTLEEKKEILVFRKIIALLLLNMTLYAQ